MTPERYHIPRYWFMAIAMMTIFLFPLRLPAQGEPLLSQYWAVPTLYNPAYAGESGMLRIRGTARLQWIGITNAPKSFAATADLPFNIRGKRVGTGLTVLQESLGLFSNLLVSAQGAYSLNIGKGHLGIGVQVGYYNSRFRGSEAYIPDNDDFHNPDDPSIPTRDLSGNAIDLSFGINYSNKHFHVGAAALHVAEPTVKLDAGGSESAESQQYATLLPRTLYFMGGGNIELKNTLFLLQPSMIAATDFSSLTAAMSIRATYNRFLSLGVGYRWKDAVSFMIGAEYKNFFLGYAYDYPLSSISKASSGSHEIVAGYSIRINTSRKNRHKHRSIRIM